MIKLIATAVASELRQLFADDDIDIDYYTHAARIWLGTPPNHMVFYFRYDATVIVNNCKPAALGESAPAVYELATFDLDAIIAPRLKQVKWAKRRGRIFGFGLFYTN